MSFIPSESLEVFKNKNFRSFVSSRFFLTLAVQMQFATLSLQVYYEFSKDVLNLGLMGLAEAVPFIVTSFFSGHVSDKFNKKRIIIGGIAILTLSSLVLFFNAYKPLSFLHSFGLSTLFTIIFLFGIVRSFLAASIYPYLSTLIERKHYTHSATWNSTLWHIACIVGPVLAGVIYGFHNQLNAAWCHGTEVILLLISLVGMIRVNTGDASEPADVKENVIESIKVGVNFVFKNKMILSAVSLDLFAVLFGGAVAIIPAFTDQILHLGPEAYGVLRIAPAAGAVLMALVMMFHPPAKKAGVALLWSVAAFGVFTVLFALCTNYWLAFLMLLCTGAFDNVSVVVRHSIIQLMTPDDMRGRVSAINSIFIGSSNEIGAFESGSTARLMGLVPSIIFGGIMTVAVVLGIHRLNPELKKLDIKSLQ